MGLSIAIPVKTQLKIFLVSPILKVNGRVQVGKATGQANKHDWFLLIYLISHIKSLGE